DNQTMERVGDTWIWTNTLELEAGTYEYKYFLNAGWNGGEWEGGDNRSLTVDADMTVNDVWGIPETVFELTLIADPAEGGTVDGEGFYEESEEVTLTATPAEGYLFVNWTDGDGNEVSTEASFTYTMPAANVSLTANFDLGPSVGEIGAIDINVFPNPARDNFKITANNTIRSIEIADLAGKVVYSDIINDTEISINNNFETGIYLVRILTDEGVFVRKLQIQK
ncbi:MAG: InlB B-repeat-containing protein, partial [Bacteroidota bacterium]